MYRLLLSDAYPTGQEWELIQGLSFKYQISTHPDNNIWGITNNNELMNCQGEILVQHMVQSN